MKVSFFFAWYDLWIGVFVKRQAFGVILYICPLPCCVIMIDMVNYGAYHAELKRRLDEDAFEDNYD